MSRMCRTFRTHQVEDLPEGEFLWELVGPDGVRIASSCFHNVIRDLEMNLNLVLTHANDVNPDLIISED